MVNFERMLNNAKGKPIDYNGKKVFRGEFLPLPKKKCKIRYKFISTNSEWKQGIEIHVKGKININNKTITKGIRLWEDTAPKDHIFEVETKDSKMRIDNIWDYGDGITQKWVNGSAMYFEEIPNGKRYYCNDGHPNDDFTDLIFEIIVVDELDEKDQNRKAVPGKKENV